MMDPSGWVVAFSIGVFIAIVGCLEIGFRLGRRDAEKLSKAAHEGIGPLEAAVFALLGLLLAFSFAGATSRFETRRQQIIREADAIGTAYLRLDLLPAADQPELRRLFRAYLDTRLRVYEKLADPEAAERELKHAADLQQVIWSHAVVASRRDPTSSATRLLLPAINEMIDITTARTIALHTHLPDVIIALLIGASLLSGLVAGYAMAKRMSRSWLHMVLYASIVAVTLYVVLDLEYPRFGLIRIESADQVLTGLRDSIR